MFEGKPPRASESRSSATGQMPEEALCELRWNDLVARLAASRELRLELERGAQAELASFDADSARWLSLQHDGLLRHDEHEYHVNPDDSGNGKGVYGTSFEPAGRMAPATRGNT